MFSRYTSLGAPCEADTPLFQGHGRPCASHRAASPVGAIRPLRQGRICIEPAKKGASAISEDGRYGFVDWPRKRVNHGSGGQAAIPRCFDEPLERWHRGRGGMAKVPPFENNGALGSMVSRPCPVPPEPGRSFCGQNSGQKRGSLSPLARTGEAASRRWMAATAGWV